MKHNGNIQWTKAGLAAQRRSGASVKAYLLAREPEIKAAKGRRHIGAGLGFRQHAGLVDAVEQQMIRDGEDSRLLFALRFNRAHPEAQ